MSTMLGQDGNTAPTPTAEKAGAHCIDAPHGSDAEKLLRDRVASFLERNSVARKLAARMRDETGTDFFDWLDHLTLGAGDENRFLDLGFTPEPAETSNGASVLRPPWTTRLRVLVADAPKRQPVVVALRAEHLADFAAAHNAGRIEGLPYARLRRAVVSEENGARLEAVERNGYRGFMVMPLHMADLGSIIRAKDLWRARPRHCASVQQGFDAANKILDKTLASVGPDLACQFFFANERRYWEGRNVAAHFQKLRQDRLGLGWGNHVSHSFHCSRGHVADFVQFLSRLGFQKNGRIVPSGTGPSRAAQVCVQPNLGILVYANVDLMPDEKDIDFSTTPLPAVPAAGEVGLWIGLHGESFLEAGMHNMEARFNMALLREPFSRQSIE